MIKKQHISILVFIAILFTGIAFFGNSTDQQEKETISEINTDLQDYINFSKYNLQKIQETETKNGSNC